MERSDFLLDYGFIELPKDEANPRRGAKGLGTTFSNFAYYGFVPSEAAVRRMAAMTSGELERFWSEIEPSLKKITGADKKMDRFVVYKNFPKEVLEKTEEEYWVAQILMYVGFPNELFTEDEKRREPLREMPKLKVLSPAEDFPEYGIFESLKAMPSKWTDRQKEHAEYAMKSMGLGSVSVSEYGFKLNGISAATIMLATRGAEAMVELSDASDALRLAAALSGGDPSLRTKTKFKKFSRPERRFILMALEGSANLEDDMAMRKEEFKRLLSYLHPGDFKFERTSKAYDSLYSKRLLSFEAKMDRLFKAGDADALEALKGRPGAFARKLHMAYGRFGTKAVEAFAEIVGSLSTTQLLMMKKYVSTINERESLSHPPSGNWERLQVRKNDKKKIAEADAKFVLEKIGEELGRRMASEFPNGVSLDERTEKVKLQTNDSELAAYGRGTEFDIPDEMTFIRSASYWKHKAGKGNSWFDNGWNFFDENWSRVGTCCWTSVNLDYAVFSGDPTNSKEMEGRACQMIDLYLDKMDKAGARYAVWNVLCFSGIRFSEAEEVFAALQWGVEPQKGNLFEPSRVQLAFPLRGDSMSKYVACIDVKERKLIFMDAALPSNVRSAAYNEKILEKTMPAFMEYLDSLPSVADLFEHAPKGDFPVLYSDKGVNLDKGDAAYVFRQENPENDFVGLDLSKLLSKRGGAKAAKPRR